MVFIQMYHNHRDNNGTPGITWNAYHPEKIHPSGHDWVTIGSEILGCLGIDTMNMMDLARTIMEK